MEPDYRECKEHVDKLKILLDDPQPGLFTWHEAVYAHMNTITSMWKPETGRSEFYQDLYNP